MPTPAQCAAGEATPLTIGRNLGSAALCVAAGGHTVAYVGGNAIFLCGTIIVADRAAAGTAQDDPNQCDLVDPVPDRLTYAVQLPSDYATSGKSYPVLYLLGGSGWTEKSWLEVDPAIKNLADEGVIVVMPYPGLLNFYTDWSNGEHELETVYVKTLIPYIDANYRTLADRSHRAVAGASMGGYGSMMWAARHPDLFVAALSLSGLVDIMERYPFFPTFFSAETLTARTPEQIAADPFPIWGNPYTHPIGWRNRNADDLASNLRGMSIWVTVGDGIPDPSDPSFGLPFSPTQSVVEALLHDQAGIFDAQLTALGIPHTYLQQRGIHGQHWNENLNSWFTDIMLPSFGSAPPATFDYRTADADFSVWDWTFQTDPARAPEFLDVGQAGPGGLTLTGSGTVTVTTPALFAPGQVVQVSAGPGPAQAVTADAQGRLSFSVDLGAPHAIEEFTPGADLQQLASGDYFVTRTVTFL